MGDFTRGGKSLLKGGAIFFYGKIYTSLNISIDRLHPICRQSCRKLGLWVQDPPEPWILVIGTEKASFVLMVCKICNKREKYKLVELV